MAGEQETTPNYSKPLLMLVLCFLFLAFLYLFYEHFTLIDRYNTLTEDHTKMQTKLAQFDMYYHEKYNMTLKHDIEGVTGLYVGNYFMVWVKDREYSEVMETCNHEYLHHKYRTDWEHFNKDQGGKA